LRPFCQGSPNVVFVTKSGEYDATCARELGVNGFHRIYAVHIGKPKVDDYNVGLVLTKALDGVAAGRSLTYQTHVRLSIDDCGKTIAH
jgi:hypothetical protein